MANLRALSALTVFFAAIELHDAQHMRGTGQGGRGDEMEHWQSGQQTSKDQLQHQGKAKAYQMVRTVRAGSPQMEEKQKQQFEKKHPLAMSLLSMGCTGLLKAKNNGKMEWFETQAWYHKSLALCQSLAAKSGPMDDEERPHMGKGKPSKDMLQKLLKSKEMDLLKESCEKLSMTNRDDPVQQAPWFAHAEKMCVAVQSASPAELKDLVHRQAHRAETASGQLIQQTCGKLQHEQMSGKMHRFEQEPWYPAMMAMCSKMGRKKVSVGTLEQKCKDLEKMKLTRKTYYSNSNILKHQPWYDRLNKVCTWIKNKNHKADGIFATKSALGSGGDEIFTTTTQSEGAPPVFV